MQFTPIQLKEKLLVSVDNENNVVDMPSVLQVICLLEKYPITREILEETRIGRLVNDIRKKTNNKELAKRSKELVRSWQKVVNAPSEGHATVNGGGVSPALTPRPSSVNKVHHVSPATRLPEIKVPASPAIKLPGGSPAARPSGINKVPVSPAARPAGKHGSLANRRVSPKCVNSSLSPGQQPVIPASCKPSTPSLPQTTNNSAALQKFAKRSNSSPQLYPSAKRVCTSPSVSSQPGTPDSMCSQNSRTSTSQMSNDVNSSNITAKSSANSISKRNSLKRTNSNHFLSQQTVSPDVRKVQSEANLSHYAKDVTNGQNGMVLPGSPFNGGDASTHSIKKTKGLKTTIQVNKAAPAVPPNGAVVISETPKRKRGRPPKVKPPPNPLDHQPDTPASVASSTKSIKERRSVNLGIRTDFETPTRSDKFVSMTPKVKSTAELIQSLQEKNILSVGKDTARQIKSNLIHKEADEANPSIVPDGAKPRHHRKRGFKNELVPPSTPVSLETKTQMVHKFLETSVDQASPDDLSPMKYDMPRTESPGTASTSFEDSIEGNHESTLRSNLVVASNSSRFDQSNSSAVISKPRLDEQPGTSTDNTPAEPKSLTLEEIYSKYPPLDLENFKLDEDTYDMAEPQDATEQDVTRLHREHWNGINGCFDNVGEWRNWTQTLSLQSYNSDLLHILPYVNVDD